MNITLKMLKKTIPIVSAVLPAIQQEGMLWVTLDKEWWVDEGVPKITLFFCHGAHHLEQCPV